LAAFKKNELLHVLQTVSPKASHEGHMSLKKIPCNHGLM